MMKRYSLLRGMAGLALAGTLVGCDPTPKDNGNTPATGTKTADNSPAPAGATPTYRVITNGISPFWTSMGKGLDFAKDQLKVNGDWQAPSPADHNAQVKVFSDAVALRVDGIAVSPIEADAIAPTIDKTIAGGIPVITFDSDSAKSKRLAYIGTNNFEAGRTAGVAALKLFPQGGKLMAFVGNMGAQNAADRYHGFEAALKGSKLTFVAPPFQDDKDKGKARKNVEDALTKYPDLNGLVGLYSYNGPAIVAAVKAANQLHKIKIVCFDGEPDTLRNLLEGSVDVTVVQKPYEFGRLSIELLNLLHKDKDIDKALGELKPELDKLNMKLDAGKHIIDTGVDVLTPQNAKPFIDKLKEKGLEST